MPDLGTFDGFDIGGIRMKVTKAGDGLSKAMAANGENEPHRKGTTVSIVLRGLVGKVEMVPDKDDPERVYRVEVIETETITVVDDGLVDDVIADQEKRNADHEDRLLRAKEAKAGVQRLPVSTSEDVLDPDLEESE